jgi:hypothetical protein
MSLIRNSNRTKQGLDFTGVQNGKIHPSDIDAVLEFDNEVLILIESKYKGTKIPTGQRILLERICNSWHTSKSCVIKVEHDFDKDNIDVPIDRCVVTEVYYNGTWIYKNNIRFVDYLNTLGNHWDCYKCKF